MPADAVENMLSQVGHFARPPLERWHPPLSGVIDIRIDADGRWFHEGVSMRRQELVKLFASILRFEDDEGFVLVTPVEKWRIHVEDAPFIATAVVSRQCGGLPCLCFATNVGEEVCADASHPLFLRVSDGVSKPYLQLRHGICAKLSRPVYYELAGLAATRDGRYGVWSGGVFFPLEA